MGQVAGADFLQPTPAISATVDAEKRSKRRREVKPEGVGGMSEIDCMSGMIGKSGGGRSALAERARFDSHQVRPQSFLFRLVHLSKG